MPWSAVTLEKHHTGACGSKSAHRCGDSTAQVHQPRNLPRPARPCRLQRRSCPRHLAAPSGRHTGPRDGLGGAFLNCVNTSAMSSVKEAVGKSESCILLWLFLPKCLQNKLHQYPSHFREVTIVYEIQDTIL